MKKTFLLFTLLLCGLCVLTTLNSGCRAYNFSGRGTIPDTIHTVRVNFIENRAPYVNPQLSPNLTDRLKQKIGNQTRLTQVNNDNVDWDIRGYVSDYSPSTVGITSTNGHSQTSVNRLTVTVHISIVKPNTSQPQEFDVSHSFDFSANQSLQQAEAQLLDEIVRNLTDEIFNRLFSDW
ncbi:MAG: LPS assembly lipoprotein LptE [Flavisolibacter sp.]